MRRFMVLIIAVGLFSQSQLKAQITCSKNRCTYLPLSQTTLDQMFYDFKTQYTNKLFEDMAVAASLANLTSAPVGSVNLYGWTMGVSAGIGYVPVTEVTIPITGYGELKDIPRAGAAVNPRIFFGANVGWLFNAPYDPWEPEDSEPGWFSLSKFDVYGSVMQDKRKFALDDKGGDLSVQTRNLGFDVRYHLVEGKPLAGGPMLRFLGVSVGTGFHRASLDIEAKQLQDQKIKIALTGGSNLIWDGANIMTMQSKATTIPFEINTGLQMLYVLNLTFGAGMAINKGSADFVMTRVGPVYLSSDSAALMAALAGQTVTSSSYNSYLTMQLTGTGTAPKSMIYGKLGVDLNIFWLKVFAEGTFTKQAYAGNVGVRFQM